MYKMVPCFIFAFRFWSILFDFCFSAFVELNWLFVDRNKIHSGTKDMLFGYIPDYPFIHSLICHSFILYINPSSGSLIFSIRRMGIFRKVGLAAALGPEMSLT